MHTRKFKGAFPLGVVTLLTMCLVALPHVTLAKNKESGRTARETQPAVIQADTTSGNDAVTNTNDPQSQSVTPDPAQNAQPDPAPQTSNQNNAADSQNSATDPAQNSQQDPQQPTSAAPASKPADPPAATSTSTDTQQVTSPAPATITTPSVPTDEATRTIRRQQPHTLATTTPSSATSSAGTIGSMLPPDAQGTVPSGKSQSNNDIPAAIDYYPPLDSLSPEFTYALSFIAMGLGIAGAMAILKTPREKRVWMPNIAARETLLEP